MDPQDPQSSHEPVVVFATSRDDEMALAKSMLQAGDVEFFTRNEMIADLFGYGRLGGGSKITGPMEILVAPRDAEFAKEILNSLGDVIHSGKRTIVLTTRRKDELEQAKTQLDSAGIPYFVSTKVIDKVIQAQLLIPQSDIESAHKLLFSSSEGLDRPVEPPASSLDEMRTSADQETIGHSPLSRMVRMIAIVLLFMLIVGLVSNILFTLWSLRFM
jgi:hypothetical protein